MSGGTAFFSLAQTLRQRMRKCSGSSIPTVAYQKKINMLVFFFFLPAIDISVDLIGINATKEPCVSGLVSDRGESWFHADWDA